MARPWRIEYPGAVYHILSRGNNRQAIFLDDPDRKKFLELLSRVCRQYDFEILAFCLMNNHYHLFLRTPKGNLSQGMHWLNTSYTTFFNWRHQRIGHLFQGRYKSVLLLDDSHYLHLSMYLHLNPVRAGMVENPREYPWSSFPDYIGRQSRFEWLQREEILGHFGAKNLNRFRNYQRECLALVGIRPKFIEQLKSAAILGPAEKIEELLKKYRPKGQLKTVPGYAKTAKEMINPERELEKVAKTFAVKRKDLGRKKKNFPARQAAYYHLVENCKMTSREAARIMGVSNTGVILGIRRLRDKLSRDQSLRKKLDKISYM